jgi:uncharacterized membrane protein YdbT with pleckstrin-like domain
VSNAVGTLQADEKVLLEAKLSLWAVLAPAIVLTIGIVVFLFASSSASSALLPVALLIAIVGAWLTATALVNYLTTTLSLTSARIVGKSGLLKPRSTDSALNKIDRVQVVKPALGRLLGYGTVIVTISGSGRGRERFSLMNDPDMVAKTIREEADAIRRVARR